MPTPTPIPTPTPTPTTVRSLKTFWLMQESKQFPNLMFSAVVHRDPPQAVFLCFWLFAHRPALLVASGELPSGWHKARLGSCLHGTSQCKCPRRRQLAPWPTLWCRQSEALAVNLQKEHNSVSCLTLHCSLAPRRAVNPKGTASQLFIYLVSFSLEFALCASLLCMVLALGTVNKLPQSMN